MCIYAKTEYDCAVIDSASSTIDLSVEILFLQCKINDFTTVIAVCYHPPNPRYQPSTFVCQLSEIIEQCTSNIRFDLMVIAGDFNSLNTDFISNEYGMMQIVTQVTHGHNTIDKVFVSDADLYNQCFTCKSVVKTKHMAVLFRNTWHAEPAVVAPVRTKKKVPVYDLRQPNIDRLRCTLGTYNWSVLYDMADIDEMYSAFLHILLESIKYCIPVKNVSIRDNEPFYITPLVKSLLNKRNKLRRKGRRDEADLIATKINNLITDVRRRHLTKLSLSNSKELWKAVKSNSAQSTSLNCNFPILSDPDVVNNFFAKISTSSSYNLSDIIKLRCNSSETQYRPILEYEIEILLRRLKNTSPGYGAIPCWLLKSCSCELAGVVSHIVNRSLSTGTVPSNWRVAVDTPIAKKSKPLLLSDFRPISVTPILSRLTEKILVKTWIKPVISTITFIDQYGFKDTGSTTCALVKILNDIVSSLDNNDCNQVKMLMVDYSKAFDVVDHLVVLRKFNDLNLPWYINNWVNSFLTGRSQMVKTNGVLSSKIKINRGIVQGSALGPFLFTIMISDLKTLSDRNFMVKYADDETVVIPSSSKASVKSEWNNIKDWAQDNGLFINVAKTAQMSIYRSLSAKTDIRNIILNDLDEIKEVNQCRLLGVVIDSKLSFSEHVSSLLQTYRQRFYLLKLLKTKAPLLLFYTLYISLLLLIELPTVFQHGEGLLPITMSKNLMVCFAGRKSMVTPILFLIFTA